MKNITIILPVHKFDDYYKQMIENAINSTSKFYTDVKLIVVFPKSIVLDIVVDSNIEIKYLVHDMKDYDFCSQVNYGIENCDTEWFSILEVDDEYTKIWLKIMYDYIKNNKDVSVFLPIVKDINMEGTFLSYTNESAWAYGFTTKQGFIDNEVLLEFQNYQISGGLYKTSVIKEMGMFKNNIKLTFGYEFLLRLTHNSVPVMIVPRIGYQHVNFREDSLFYNYKNDENKLTEKEIQFWVDTAKKEFFFKNKREVKYVE